MDTSIFLAQVFGLYFLIAGIALLVRPQAMQSLMKVLNTRTYVYMTGFVALLIGVPLVLIHNVWDGSWRVIITVLCWLALLKGVARLYAPAAVADWVEGLAKNKGMMQILIIIMVILGAYLTYVGFSM